MPMLLPAAPLAATAAGIGTGAAAGTAAAAGTGAAIGATTAATAATVAGAGAGAGAAGTAGGFSALTALKTASTVASLAGTGMKFYGEQQAMKQQEAMQEYNAELADQEASQRTQEGQERARRMRRRNRSLLSEQRGAFTKAGLTMSGTALAVMSQTAADLELGVLDEAYKTRTQVRSLKQSAASSRMGAEATKKARSLAGASTLIGGANQLARTRL